MASIHKLIRNAGIDKSPAKLAALLQERHGDIGGKPVTIARVKRALEKIHEKESAKAPLSDRPDGKSGKRSERTVRGNSKRTEKAGSHSHDDADRPPWLSPDEFEAAGGHGKVRSSSRGKSADADDKRTRRKSKAKPVPERKEASAEEIVFNGKVKKYRWLSNFLPCCLIIQIGKKTLMFANAEAAFQYFKTPSPAHQEKILDSVEPSKARYWGSKKAECPLRDDWEEVKLDVMYHVLLAKFSQNVALRGMLLATGDAELVELAPWDKEGFWGTDRDGNGDNNLGILLMRVRDELREDPDFVSYRMAS